MAKTRRSPAPSLPRPLGVERFEVQSLDEVVAALGTPHHERAALWTLVAAGPEALEAVKRGLDNSSAAVRRGCCEYLDLYGDDEAAQALVPLLEDSDDQVRWMAAHALTCERCKIQNTWIKRQQQRRR
jgi:HEAT repeat protein